ncbi:MAG: glycosyltransferase [Bacteroidales bacterium]
MGILITCMGSVVILIYVVVFIRYGNALLSAQGSVHTSKAIGSVKVSVIIPVRNEFYSLPLLIDDLDKQNYLQENYEVIFVNDHSNDGSETYLIEICQSRMNFSFCSLDSGFLGKKQAIDKGCSIAKGDWIIQTDADCRLPSGFISGHADLAFAGKAGLIAGPVLTESGKGMWCSLESIEMMSLTGTGMASFLLGRPVMCSGANLSYNKAFYMEVREEVLKVPSASGDDMFLLMQAKKLDKGMAYLNSFEHLVTTSLNGSIYSFISQRVRWGSKARFYSDRDLLFLSMVVWLTNAIITLYLVGSFFIPLLLPFFLASWIIKSGVDFRVLYLVARIFRRTRQLRWFPLAALFYYFYVTVAGLLAMYGKYSWKDRTYYCETKSHP